MTNLNLETTNFVMMGDVNASYRQEMRRAADRERLAALARAGEPRRDVAHALVGWTGRRLLAVGNALVMVADSTRPEPMVQVDCPR